MFSFLKLRHALLGVAAVPFLISIQGCNDRDALATVATIGVVGGAVAVGSSYNNGYNDGYSYNCNGYYGCGYYDQRGYYRRGYYNDNNYNRNYNGRGYYRGYHKISATTEDQQMASTGEEAVTEDLNNTASVAAHYGIPMQAASLLKNTLRTTVEGNSMQPIYDLGLSTADLQRISQNRDISDAGLQKVSAKLGLSVEQTRMAVRQMMSDAQSSQVQSL